jgi:mono/diheme cytochrome c family protein
MTRKSTLAVIVLVAGGLTRTASATVDMQKKAKAAGFEAQNCLYCHGEKLPKKGASTLSDRGNWLVAEKDKRKAKEVDAAWLKDYVEKKK